jgi:glycosyltransferase involved in cell wall biosynthesis
LRFLQRAVNPVRDMQAYRELTARLADYRPDLVSTHTAKAGWIGRAASARLGLPALYTPHGWPFAERMGRARGLTFGAAERIAAKWAGGIVCVSEYERDLALRWGIAGPEKLQVIHNGVRDVAASLRAAPASRPVRIVSVARMEPPKDYRTLLEALSSLRADDWELELVGGGPQEQSARELAAALGIGGRVRWAGYQPDPSALLARAQIFVLSSLSEGFPRSILEAMRAGLPVVASDVGGVCEAVVNGANGYLVPKQKPAALARGLEKLLKDDSERQRLGAAARRTYEERFRFERMFEKTLVLYATVRDNIHAARNEQPA